MLKGINLLLSPELLKLLPGVSTRAYAIVQTGELQAWSNFVFGKGVIAEDLRA